MSLFLSTSGVLGHDMMEADGLALASGYLLLSLLVHTTALAVASMVSLKRRANRS